MNRIETLAVVAAFGLVSSAAAQVPVEIRIGPGLQTLGSKIAVEVHLNGSADIADIALALQYDPTILRPSSPPWRLGPVWQTGTTQTTFNGKVDPLDTPTGPNSDGIAYIGEDWLAKTVPGTPKGPGLLLFAEFTIISGGTTPLRCPSPWGRWNPNPQFLDPDGATIPLAVTDTTLVLDGVPPAAISDVSIMSATDTSITLAWTAPGDDGAAGTAAQYDIRYAKAPISDETAYAAATQLASEPAPAVAGTFQMATASGLDPATTYYFVIKTADEFMAWSPFSNPIFWQTGTPPPDTTAPLAITDLSVTAVDIDWVTVQWTAPGDDGPYGTAAAYDLRYTLSGPITTDDEFDAATPALGEPLPSAGTQTFVQRGLIPTKTYWFALRTGDEALNWSFLSNSATVQTGIDGSKGGTALCSAGGPDRQDVSPVAALALCMVLLIGIRVDGRAPASYPLLKAFRRMP